MSLSSLFARKPLATTATPAVASPRPPFNVKSYGLSDRGKVRSSNEDCFLIAELARTLQVHQTNLPQSKAFFSCHRGQSSWLRMVSVEIRQEKSPVV